MTESGAKPASARLESLLSEEESATFFLANPRTPEQIDAHGALSKALITFERAFGGEALDNQLAFAIACRREMRRFDEVTGRVLTARAWFNVCARICRDNADIAMAERCEAQPTPRYPGWKADQEFLKGYAAHGL